MSKKFRDNQKEIGHRLKVIRTTLDLTLDRMHEKTKFSKSIICEIENGKKSPSSIYLYALADLFNVNINYVLTGKGEMFLEKGIDLKRNFGNDHETIREMIDYLEKYDLARYFLLMSFTRFKMENWDLFDKDPPKSKNR